MTSSTDPANVLTAEFQTPILQPIQLWDQTLRDGEQTPKLAFTQDEKIELAHAIDSLGVFGMNVGYPAVSAYEAETVRKIARLGLRAELATTSRLVREDVDAVASVGVQWAFTFVSLSDWHIRDKLNTTEEKLLEKVYDVIPYAISKGLKVAFAIEDATRTPMPRMLKFIQAAEEVGASCIRICDTVGILTPTSTLRFIAALRPAVRTNLCMHFHNDLGMATANTITGFEAGADSADGALAGLGERAGNAPMEELAVVLKVKYGRDIGFRLDRIVEVAAMVARAANILPPHNKPIVGESVFSHESGIHVAGLLANPITYEPFPPALINRKHQIIFGKHSGLSGLRHLLARHNISLDPQREKALLDQVKRAGQAKEEVPEDRVLVWARAMTATTATQG